MNRGSMFVMLAVLGACFDPTYPHGLTCGPDGWCPAGQACDPVDNRCKSVNLFLDAGSNADGPLPNGPVDAAPLDAYFEVFPPVQGEVAHVPLVEEYAGSADLELGEADKTVVIDTDGVIPTIDGQVYPKADAADMMPSIAFVVASQEVEQRQSLPTPELAILHVKSLTVPAGATVRIQGQRPLVVIASDKIAIHGQVDASGHGVEPGPGGSATDGPQPGTAGRNHETAPYNSGGGGGGGFGCTGGTGGTGCVVEPDPQEPGTRKCDLSFNAELGAQAGAQYQDELQEVLIGGSAGGAGGADLDNAACPPGSGGAGGGAIQLYSDTEIVISDSGSLNAGGGGGGAGTAKGGDCGDESATAGGGGGSGGTIFLQAPAITVDGILAANGGGGGGAGGNSDNNPDNGNGQDGQLGNTQATGGVPIEPNIDGRGGQGGVDAQPNCMANADTTGQLGTGGGGGGGGAGRIAIVTQNGSHQGKGIISPHPTSDTLPTVTAVRK